MADVARVAGVSSQTVSRVILRPDLVTEPTRLKVQNAIRRLGYIPNAAARSLAANSSRTVVVIIPALTSSSYAFQVASTMAALEPHGISTVVGYSDYSREREESLVHSLLQYRPLGFILTGLDHTTRCAELLRTSGATVIETWSVDGDPIDMAVGFSNVDAGRDVAKVFLERGTRRVAFVGGTDARAALRAKGLDMALTEAGLPPVLRLEYPAPMDASVGITGLVEMCVNGPRPDAILFSADFLALAALYECQRRGIRVPDDVAVCGFGDHELSPLSVPGLTTVKLFPEEMGRLSAEILLNRIRTSAGPTRNDTNRVITLQHQIVRRGSA